MRKRVFEPAPSERVAKKYALPILTISDGRRLYAVQVGGSISFWVRKPPRRQSTSPMEAFAAAA